MFHYDDKYLKLGAGIKIFDRCTLSKHKIIGVTHKQHQ